MDTGKLKLRKRGFSGTLSPKISEREAWHRQLARRAAAEGMVLLENDGILPLAPGSRLALYSGGARYGVKGGTGSGSVNNRQNVSIDEGLRKAGFIITTDEWLDSYDQIYRKKKEEWIRHIYEISRPEDFFSLYNAYSANPMEMPQGDSFTKTEADTAIYVISRISGESVDRRAVRGDYIISEREEGEMKELASLYPHLIVILNVGGVIDLSFLEEIPVAALLLMSQAGMEGGNALADVLSGKINPSGRLTDTWAFHYEDYPSWDTFSHNNGNLIQEKYTEGIYVGYRYFDSFEKKPRYPFGYGLSYTAFDYRIAGAGLTEDQDGIQIEVLVTNTGNCPGREVIQLYAACPQNEQAKERKRLVAFAKTKLLEPGMSQLLRISFGLRQLESYRTGKARYCMEKGRYLIFAGISAEEILPAAVLTLEQTVMMEKMDNICPLLDSLAEITPDRRLQENWAADLEGWTGKENTQASLPVIAIDRAEEKIRSARITPSRLPQIEKEDCLLETVQEIMAHLTPLQKAQLVCGQPSAGSSQVIGAAAIHVPGAAGETTGMLEQLGIGALILADGPAGLRLLQHYEENPEDGSIYQMTRYQSLQNRFFGTEFLHEGAIDHYQYCSAIPVGTLLAQTFDPELLEETGRLIGREMKEMGVTLWLAPGMNIHRNPLCGRNFEYYSEDPLVSGIMAAAITRGVQSFPGIGVTIKHFACNNQEDNRMGVSSIVSERALREIYLKGFETAIRREEPMAIMTSYNRINSVHSANNYDLCTIAARKEWGFTGIIMTDWLTTNGGHGSSAVKCIQAGNDLIMPGNESDIREILDALEEKKDLSLSMEDLDQCVSRMLGTILKSDIYEDICG